MKAICISASNMMSTNTESTSYKISEEVAKSLEDIGIMCEIIDLRDYTLSPCIGCGGCFDSRRCSKDTGFNDIYNKIVKSDLVLFVSPHYAPIPAKLSMLLEKMEEITFLHWWKDNAYKSEMHNLPAGIISHGGGSDWALSSYKAMVNDTIANALDTIQCRIIPYNSEWNTGISLPVMGVEEENSIFPVQKYDWDSMVKKIQEYIKIIVDTL